MIMLRQRRRLGGGLLCTLLAFGCLGPVQAQLPSPKGQPKKEAPRTYTFSFNNAPWSQVLIWLSEVHGLPIITNYRPTGTFTFIPSKDATGKEYRKYTVPEIIDILNESLLAQKFIIVRRQASLGVYPADEVLDAALIPTARMDDLADRGNTEVVRLVLPLKVLAAESLAPGVRRMLGPFGLVIPLAAANQLILIDTVGNLRVVVSLLQALEDHEEGAPPLWSHKCQYCKAVVAVERLKDILGDPGKAVESSKLETGEAKGGATSKPALPTTFTADERTNSVFVSGPPDKIALARAVVAKLDVPTGPDDKPRVGGEPVLKTYTVPAGSAEAVVGILKEAMKSSPSLKIAAAGNASILVYAQPDDQMAIAKLLAGVLPPPGNPGKSNEQPEPSSDPDFTAAGAAGTNQTNTGSPAATQPEPKPQPFQRAPDEDLNCMKYHVFTQMVCTRDALEAPLWRETLRVERKSYEAKLWNILQSPGGAGILRLRTMPGLDRIPLVKTARHEVILYARVLKIEEFRMTLRVMLNSRDPLRGGKWWRYPEADDYFKLHAADLDQLKITAPEDRQSVYLLSDSFWSKQTAPGKGAKPAIKILAKGKVEIRSRNEADKTPPAQGLIVYQDLKVVILKVSGPLPEKAREPGIAYERIYRDPEVIYTVNDSHLALLVAAKKARPEDADHLYVVNGTFFHNYLVPEGLVKVEGTRNVEFYGGLMRAVILPNPDKDDTAVVVLRIEAKYCLFRGDGALNLPSYWHEGIVALHLGDRVEECLRYPLPASEVQAWLKTLSFAPKGQSRSAQGK
jgi:hypothetical protein